MSCWRQQSSSFWNETDNPLFGISEFIVEPLPMSPDFLLMPTVAESETHNGCSDDEGDDDEFDAAGRRRKKRSRMLAVSTADAAASGKRRRRSARRKQRQMPQVLPPKEALAAKYPHEIKEAISQCLRGKLEFDIHDLVRGSMRRPALKDLATYWFVAWHFVRCYIRRWPLLCLPRSDALVQQLLAAQSIFMQRFPQIMHEESIDRQRREHFRASVASDLLSSASTRPTTVQSSSSCATPNAVRTAVISNSSSTRQTASTSTFSAAATASVVTTSVTSAAALPSLLNLSISAADCVRIDESARQVFEECCQVAQVTFAVDPLVAAYVDEETSTLESASSTGVGSKKNKTPENAERKRARLTAYRRTMFECFAMFILAVAERAGDIYLKRSSVNGYLVELSRAKEAFERQKAFQQQQSQGVSQFLVFSADDIAVGRRFDSVTNDICIGERLANVISHGDVRVARRHISEMSYQMK